MNSKIAATVCFLLLAVGMPAFSQNVNIDIAKAKDDARNASVQDAKGYGIVDITKTDDTFEIVYDLAGTDGDDYTVSLALLRDGDPSFRLVPKLVTGMIGTGAFAGKNKSIVWNYKKELPADLPGSGYRFELSIQKVEKSSFPWLWVGVGVVAGGVAAAVLLGGGSKDAAAATMTIPAIDATGTRPN